MKKIITFLTAVVLTAGLSAQSPQKLSYQCVIRNTGGGLVTNHIVGIKISILRETPLGSVVYQEIFNPVPQTNANGLVSIEIGGGVPLSGTFSTINWASGPYFLKTETDPDGGNNYTISGTSQLLSVPYAIYAKTAENGFSGNYYDLTNKPILFSGNYNDLTNKPVLFDGSWVNLSGKPTTISGYGITDAVTITGNQTITGIKTFSNDLLVNELTIGKGKNAVSSNTAIGNSALCSNTTGLFNTANGSNALYSNTEGLGNTASGYRALYSNTTGVYNTAYGHKALYSNTEGERNTAIGLSALYSNTTGDYNTANGQLALNSNTEGERNTAIGAHALYLNTTGDGNTATGALALAYNTTGNDNSAYGYYALFYNTSGHSNTANGDSALYSNTTGNFNTANGALALRYNTTGMRNTANGYYALYANATGNSNTANGDNSLHLNATGGSNTAIGTRALYSNTSGYYNTSVGYNALYSNTAGINNTAIGYYADVTLANLTNATAIGNGAKVNASNKVRIGNSNVTVIEGQVNWSVGSDRRLKENIGYSDKLGLEFVNGLETVTFTYKDDPAKRHHDGLIAQDVKNTLEKFGLTFSALVESENEDKTLNLSYSEFVIPLINSVKELNNKNQGQQKHIENLQEEINELKFLVNSLIAKKTEQGNK